MSYVELAKKIQAGLKLPNEPTDAAGMDTIIDGTVVAVLIDSTILGALVWFGLRDGWRPDEGDTTPVFYASELSALRTKSPEQLREIFKVKTAFVGGGDDAVRLISLEAVAQFLGMSRASVQRMITDGSLEAVCLRAGKRKKVLRIRDDVLRKFLKIGKNEPFDPQPALIVSTKKPRVKTVGDDETERATVN